MKKIFAIALAVVMIFALSVSVFAEEAVVYSVEYKDRTNAWDVCFNTAEDTAFTDALDAVGDDAIITFTMSAADWSVFSYAELAIQDNAQTGWPGNEWGNCTYLNARYDTDTVTVTYGQFKEDLAVGGWDVHDVKIVVNSDAAAPITLTITVVDPNPATEEAPAEEEATAPAEETTEAPAATTPAPSTGLALAVVPAVMALAAVAVSKKH